MRSKRGRKEVACFGFAFVSLFIGVEFSDPIMVSGRIVSGRFGADTDKKGNILGAGTCFSDPNRLDGPGARPPCGRRGWS